MNLSEMFGEDVFESEHKAEYIDRSDLEAVATCPQQGRLRKQHEGEFETHDVLPEAGTIVHAIAEEAIKFCEESLQDAADMIAEELPKARPDLQPEVLRAGRNLANELRRFGSNRVLLCEQQLTRSIMPLTAQRGELLVTTAPDLVLATAKADTIVVLDYKTGYKKRTNAEVKDAFQTATLAWCLLGKYPDVQTIHFWYLETRLSARAYAKIERERDEVNIQARIFEAARLYFDGRSDAWPEHSKCSMCPVLCFCKYAEPVCKELNGDVKAFVDNTVVLAELLKKREEAITAAVKAGRTLYGSCGFYDDAPKKKPAQKISYKVNSK